VGIAGSFRGISGLPAFGSEPAKAPALLSVTAMIHGGVEETGVLRKPLISLIKPSLRNGGVQGQKSAKSSLEGSKRRDHLQGVQTKGTPEMIKNTVIALLAVASISAVALPAYADTNSIFGSGDNEAQDWVADTIVTRLQQQGVNATSVEEWGGLVRAYVTLEDGSEVMQFFTPGTLQPTAL
jgi:hypothetical protein